MVLENITYISGMEFLKIISGPAIIGFIIGLVMSILSHDLRPMLLTFALPLAVMCALFLVGLVLWIQEKIFK
jgi:uncharacterized membrane protein YvlD (DUF360 family)